MARVQLHKVIAAHIESANAAWKKIVQQTRRDASHYTLETKYLLALEEIFRPTNPALDNKLQSHPKAFKFTSQQLRATVCSFEQFCADVTQHGSPSY